VHKFQDIVLGFWQLGQQYKHDTLVSKGSASCLPMHIKVSFDKFIRDTIDNVAFEDQASAVTVRDNRIDFRLCNSKNEVFFVGVERLCSNGTMTTSESWCAWVSYCTPNLDGGETVIRTGSISFETAIAYIPQTVIQYLADWLDREDSTRLHKTAVKIANFHSFKLDKF
jgi:hypothetical protein